MGPHICSKVDCLCGCSYCALCYDGCPQCGRGKLQTTTTTKTDYFDTKYSNWIPITKAGFSPDFPVWKPLKSLDELPRDESFILFDKNRTSGLSIYEAIMFDNETMGCPATHEEYKLEDFSHWCEMIQLPEDEK